MFVDLKSYPAMKDSGAEWLGAVPKHWSVVPNRALFDEVKDRNHPDEEMLSVTITRGVVPQRTLLADSSKKDSSNLDRTAYKLVQPRDIAYNKMRAWQGAIGISDYRGIISPAYVVMRLRATLNPRYFHYLYRTPQFAKEAERWSYGITSDMWSLRPEHFRLIYSLLPPPEEQAAIVRFLDYADRRIRSYIRSKQKLIKLLEEQKQAIINRLVTHGLNAGVRFRAAEIESLDTVPERWIVKPFVRCCIERADYRGATPTKTDSGVFLVTAKNIRKGWIDYESSREYVNLSEYDVIMRRGRPKLGDLLLTTEAPLGNAALVDREDVALAQRVIRFRLNPSVALPRFMLHAVLSRYFQDQLLCRATGSTASGIKASKLPQLLVALPSLEEQERIVEQVIVHTKAMDSSIATTSRQLAHVREFRTKLIADIVTGKLDVRAISKEIQEEIQDAATGKELGALAEEDEEANEENLEEAVEEAEA